ncbi:MAG: RlpA-like double-psi beta-barrel domain-containing protein [Chloroflexota bacterium]
MTRPLGVVAALLVAAIVSLSAATLSVARQQSADPSHDPHQFTAIVPTGTPGSDAASSHAPGASIGDFADHPSFPPRATPVVRPPVAVVPIQPRPTRMPTRTKPAHAAPTHTKTVIVKAPTSSGSSSSSGGSHRVSGRASWFCKPGTSACTSGYNGGMYAAAGSEIRIGNWRGRVVTVCGNGHCIRVKLIDWCACAGSRIIDLYNDAFSRLASPSVGTLAVTISW